MAVRKPAAKAPAAPKAAAAPAPAVEAPVAAAAETPAPAKPKAKEPVEAVAAAVGVDVSGVQDNLRKAALKSIEQGRAAYDRMKEASEEAAHSIEASFAASSKGAAELASKALELVKTNANATFDHLKALAGAKNLADAVSMHGQFIRAQSEVAVSQAKEIAELAKKTATEASAPIQEQLKKPLTPKA